MGWVMQEYRGMMVGDTQNPWPPKCNQGFLVERTRIELVTSCLQSKCSTN